MKPGRGHAVEGKAVERELEQRRCADAVGESRARDLRAALGVDPGQLEVVARLEGEGRRLADAAELDGVLVGEPVGRARVGRRGDPLEQLGAALLGGRERLLDLLELRLHALQLLDLLGRRLPLQLRLRAELVGLRHERQPGPVRLHERVEVLGRTLAGQGRAIRVRIGSARRGCRSCPGV